MDRFDRRHNRELADLRADLRSAASEIASARRMRIAVGLESGYTIDGFTHDGTLYEIIWDFRDGEDVYGVREAGATQLLVSGRSTLHEAKEAAVTEIDSLNDLG